VQMVEAGESPEVVVKALGFSRGRIYEWLARYREGGLEALRFKGIPGKRPQLSGADLKKLARIITDQNPRQLKFGFVSRICGRPQVRGGRQVFDIGPLPGGRSSEIRTLVSW